jgi:hypothetical protein
MVAIAREMEVSKNIYTNQNDRRKLLNKKGELVRQCPSLGSRRNQACKRKD